MDAVIVGVSIVSLAVPGLNAGVVRILRAFRIIRLFGRVPTLRKAIRCCSIVGVAVVIISIGISVVVIVPHRPHRRPRPHRPQGCEMTLSFFVGGGVAVVIISISIRIAAVVGHCPPLEPRPHPPRGGADADVWL